MSWKCIHHFGPGPDGRPRGCSLGEDCICRRPKRIPDADRAAIREALKAYEAWEASIILEADWSDSLPKLTQPQWDRLLEIQTMRNAALALIREG